MQIIDVTGKEQLNNFVGSQPMSQFLQSWQWGEFQKKISSQVWRLGVLADAELVASAVINIKDLPIGKKYLYCARGPIVALGTDKKEATRLLFGEIRRLAEQVGAMFLRFDPIEKFLVSNLPDAPTGLKHLPLGQAYGGQAIIKTLDVQPSRTLILDLTKTADNLLKEMHQKTRYNINLAGKKGVTIVAGDKTRFEEFWDLLDQTSDRDKFTPHGRSYYQAMVELQASPVKLFFAEYMGKPIATALVSFFGDTATYLHGGSSNQERNIMAPYFMHWHFIKLAQAQGQKYYDFHGIDEDKWPGVTRFKKGFGGFEKNYPGTFDLVYDQGWYSIYKMVRKVRRTF